MLFCPLACTKQQIVYILCFCYRLVIFKKSLQKTFSEKRAHSLSIAQVCETINTEHNTQPFTQSEINAAIERMTDDNQIMFSDGIVFLI